MAHQPGERHPPLLEHGALGVASLGKRGEGLPVDLHDVTRRGAQAGQPACERAQALEGIPLHAMHPAGHRQRDGRPVRLDGLLEHHRGGLAQGHDPETAGGGRSRRRGRDASQGTEVAHHRLGPLTLEGGRPYGESVRGDVGVHHDGMALRRVTERRDLHHEPALFGGRRALVLVVEARGPPVEHGPHPVAHERGGLAAGGPAHVEVIRAHPTRGGPAPFRRREAIPRRVGGDDGARGVEHGDVSVERVEHTPSVPVRIKQGGDAPQARAS